MTATVAIRRALDSADRAYVRDLGRRVAMTSVSTIRLAPEETIVDAYERLVDFIVVRDHAVFIAENGEGRCGFATVIFDLPDEVTLADQAFVPYMAVEPSRAGRGIGRALLAEVEALARRRGFSHLSLMVTEDNAPARALYAAAGFATERRMLTKVL
jgi:ribosomal protein S18 acetylase RimI-like enzyme